METDYQACNDHYHLQKPTKAHNTVEAYSVQYIPFEPKDWQLTMRNELRQAIGAICPKDRCLYAAYISESQRFCDVENVLFYNIGTSVFSPLSKRGLCFERGFDVPPNIGVPFSDMRHYYHYAPGNDFRLWKKQNTLASWDNIMLSTPKSTSKPHLFWHALKNGTIYADSLESAPLKYGLDIQLNVPESAWCNLAVLIKPLLDGTISAFHHHNGICDDEMLKRLSGLTGDTVEKLASYLCDSKMAVLGKRSVVSAYRKGVKWNPADDGCVACRVTINRTQKASNWRMSGELFSVLSLA